MPKKEFLDTKLVAEITTEILLKKIAEKNLSLRQVSKTLHQSYAYVWGRLNGTKGSYEFYESVAIVL